MKTIVFDMDGVVFDSEQLVKKCWKKVAKDKGIDGIETVFYDCLGTNKVATRKILEDYYQGTLDIDMFFELTRQEYYDYIEKNGVPLKPYIKELLTVLKAMGYKIGMASSTRYESIVYQLEKCQLLQFYDYIIGGDMVVNSKPNPEIFIKCVEGLGGDVTTTYVIEDSYNGIRAAYAAGMKPIMVPDMVMPDEEMKSKALVLDNLCEVAKYFREINN